VTPRLDDTELSGRTAMVTGSARGLGATYARALADSGAYVVIVDLLQADGEASAAAVRVACGGRALFVQADVSNYADAARAVEMAARRFGSVDILVNNAGLYGDLGAKKPFDEITEAEWDRVMAVNVKGMWHCAKAVAPHMRKQRRGKIINVASSSVYAGTPGLAHYVASKAAVIGLTRVLAQELGDDQVCVNAIAPGLVHNEAGQRLNREEYFERNRLRRAMKRLMMPEDLVGTVLFLASPASDFITGQTFVVDGGAAMI
jgi:NAD(P)-dependent dehydrogenase (short-subunit alcohol dehydrogenase family)